MTQATFYGIGFLIAAGVSACACYVMAKLTTEKEADGYSNAAEMLAGMAICAAIASVVLVGQAWWYFGEAFPK